VYAQHHHIVYENGYQAFLKSNYQEQVKANEQDKLLQTGEIFSLPFT
jgi:hypothetical protein